MTAARGNPRQLWSLVQLPIAAKTTHCTEGDEAVAPQVVHACRDEDTAGRQPGHACKAVPIPRKGLPSGLELVEAGKAL
jgi:hypothetical protein